MTHGEYRRLAGLAGAYLAPAVGWGGRWGPTLAYVAGAAGAAIGLAVGASVGVHTGVVAVTVVGVLLGALALAGGVWGGLALRRRARARVANLAEGLAVSQALAEMAAAHRACPRQTPAVQRVAAALARAQQLPAGEVALTRGEVGTMVLAGLGTLVVALVIASAHRHGDQKNDGGTVWPSGCGCSRRPFVDLGDALVAQQLGSVRATQRDQERRLAALEDDTTSPVPMLAAWRWAFARLDDRRGVGALRRPEMPLPVI